MSQNNLKVTYNPSIFFFLAVCIFGGFGLVLGHNQQCSEANFGLVVGRLKTI